MLTQLPIHTIAMEKWLNTQLLNVIALGATEVTFMTCVPLLTCGQNTGFSHIISDTPLLAAGWHRTAAQAQISLADDSCAMSKVVAIAVTWKFVNWCCRYQSIPSASTAGMTVSSPPLTPHPFPLPFYFKLVVVSGKWWFCEFFRDKACIFHMAGVSVISTAGLIVFPLCQQKMQQFIQNLKHSSKLTVMQTKPGVGPRVPPQTESSVWLRVWWYSDMLQGYVAVCFTPCAGNSMKWH